MDTPGPGGPAILVYYGPALIQKAGAMDPRGAIIILAGIFKKGRELFPLESGKDGETVTVRIDALKNLQVKEIMNPQNVGDVWLLSKSSSVDAQVEKVNYLHDPTAIQKGVILFTDSEFRSEARMGVT